VTHLSDEQLEDILNDPASDDRHLAQCASCRERLEGHRAVRGRLQSAFASVSAPTGLADRIRAAAQTAPQEIVPSARTSAAGRPLARVRRYAWALAAAACVVLATPLLIHLLSPAAAGAAQQELVSIHRMNLSEERDLFSDDKPANLAQYFKDKLGFAPAMPKLNQGMAIRGCCIAHFRGQIVGSYVVDTPRGLISIIAVRQKPAELNLADPIQQDGLTVYRGAFATNQLAATAVGDYTYCAVGEVPSQSLVELLGLLVR
jgi:hypothetical protein